MTPVTQNIYRVGAVATLAVTVKVDGVLTDPGALKLRVKEPGQPWAEYVYGIDGALIRDSAGTFHRVVPLNTAGFWSYKWVSTGTGAGAEVYGFVVEKDPA